MICEYVIPALSSVVRVMAERLFFGFDTSSGTGNSFDQLRNAILAIDWTATGAGSVESWSPSVRSTVRTVLHSASPMAALLGRDGVVICNEAAREMFGDVHATAQGKSVFDVLPIAKEFYRKVIEEAYQGRSNRFRDRPIKLLRQGKWQTCWFNLGLSPIADDDGQIFGTLLAASETTDHIHTRKALQLAYDRMEIALEAGGIAGTWDFDVASRKIILSGSLGKQYGYSEAESRQGIIIEELFENLHPDDRARVRLSIDEAVAAGSEFRNRFRAVTTDRTLHWYTASGRVVLDDHDTVAGFSGVLIDVTSQAEIAAALEHSNLRFDTLIGAIPQIVWSTDKYGNHDFYNARWSEFTGVTLEQTTPATWPERVHPDDWERVSQTWQDCLANGKTYDIEYRLRHHSGEYRWLWALAMPMKTADGTILRWYGTSTDIDDAKYLEVEKELVARELDHRIKNLFALVNGLIGLSIREEPALQSAAQMLRARLEALHRAHDLVRKGRDQSGSSLKRLLQELLEPYNPKEGMSVIIEGHDSYVKSEAVTSVALIFHELATNAAKYGALSKPNGVVRIFLERSDDRLVVNWEENFSNAALSEAVQSGFGSLLLETVVEKQFRGSIERTHGPSGYTVKLCLPLSLFATDQRS